MGRDTNQETNMARLACRFSRLFFPFSGGTVPRRLGASEVHRPSTSFQAIWASSVDTCTGYETVRCSGMYPIATT
ncbi:hypothetical protein N7471_004520 [Penicillium samsonianum]|uniref:uncharacterized protein n=1 Tax=Penicillium samsonianum TaxID=1882272 RepID=UPI002547CB5E|nr:uncharacterized protein N7471_004520 [Penicillium samsonianum]KAJ6138034.1 hypothetical protein N7471_004520 [Penicillium samsonianum]